MDKHPLHPQHYPAEIPRGRRIGLVIGWMMPFVTIGIAIAIQALF